jgi:hypothetical protein
MSPGASCEGWKQTLDLRMLREGALPLCSNLMFSSLTTKVFGRIDRFIIVYPSDYMLSVVMISVFLH